MEKMTELMIAVTTKYFSVCVRAKNSLSCVIKVERHDFNISCCSAFYSVKLSPHTQYKTSPFVKIHSIFQVQNTVSIMIIDFLPNF